MKFGGYFLNCFNILITLLMVNFCAFGQSSEGYQKAPLEMEEILNANKQRCHIISSNGKFIIALEKDSYPTLAEISGRRLNLAGLDINPTQRSSAQMGYTAISLKIVSENEVKKLNGLPIDYHLSEITFSPDNKYFAFINTTVQGAELWLGNIETKECKRLGNSYINNIMSKSYQWLPDSKNILVKTNVSGANNPEHLVEKVGPIIEENLGGASPSFTFPDGLKTLYEQQLFDYYATAQLQLINLDGKVSNYSSADVFRDFEVSPDGNFVLLHVLQKPYSTVLPCQKFKQKVAIHDKKGELVKNLAEIPSCDYLPQGFDAVTTGPRNFGWRSDKPATYYYVEAQDLGDPAKKSTYRDFVYTQEVTNPSPRKLAVCYYRFHKINWGNDHIAIITERWYKTRAERRVFVKPNNANYRVNLWDRYYENNYDDPGEFITVKNDYNKDVLLIENSLQFLYDKENMHIFSLSEGATNQGKKPYILKFNVKTKITDTLYRSKAPYYEKPLFFNNDGYAIISRESVTENPNLFITDAKRKNTTQLTAYTPPYPQLFGLQKKLIKYKRADGLNLSATLYLPKNYSEKDGPLPMLMWAYPREYKTSTAAGQVKSSPYQFIHISWASPIFWATQGYAVLDEVEMPIVGESNAQPNDTYADQLVQNANAAVQKVVNMGIADEKRIAIGGHSYGAFMVANLLAHSKLFAAGIARSGAYNRSLTPFGFQSEERTYWDATDLYTKMSPFTYANKIKTPILLLHGADDTNPGTYPIQTERFYQAIKGNGGVSRMVILPNEKHAYAAKESISHMLWEMDKWLETYVKNKGFLAKK